MNCVVCLQECAGHVHKECMQTARQALKDASAETDKVRFDPADPAAVSHRKYLLERRRECLLVVQLVDVAMELDRSEKTATWDRSEIERLTVEIARCRERAPLS